MALSLRDKLKFADKKPKPAPAPAPSGGVYIQEATYPLTDFPYLFDITYETLSLMEQGDFKAPFDPTRVLYLDTETTGLSTGAGTVAFLVGVGFLKGDAFIVKQFLMRDYCDEAPMLKEIEALIKQYDMLVTFNGKSFDMTLLRTRFLMNRLSPACLDLPHADLLHIARRIFKLRLQKCRLSYLEEAIFNEPRHDDLPGALIPERYFTYLKTGEFTLLEDILTHNKQDIASLCRLLAHMANMYDHPEGICHMKDIYSIGVALERRNAVSKARTFYYLASAGEMAPLSHLRLAHSHRRTREFQDAAALFETMVAKKEGGAIPYIELAKLYEHRFRDIETALEYTKKAMILLAEPTLFNDLTVQDTQNALQYRYDRLKTKREKQRSESNQ